MSAAEKLAEDIETQPAKYSLRQDDVIASGIIRVTALINKQDRDVQLANLAKVQASRPLRPPARVIEDRYVRPGAVEAAKVRAREVKIELHVIPATWLQEDR